jgi:beta-mannosidase
MYRIYFILFSFFYFSSTSFAQNQFSWNYFHPIQKVWKPFQTNGSIQEKLIQSGELPYPFYESNEDSFNWVEDYTWDLISDTLYGDSVLSKVIDIHFPSIDTYASVYWNDSLVLKAENAFRPYTVQVLLKANSKNRIKAVFTPPILYHKVRFEQESFHYPAPNDPNKIAISNLTRKPQYQFGWDWTARMNTIGFMEPVRWGYQKINSIEKLVIHTQLSNSDEAQISYKFLFNSIDQELTITSQLFGRISLKPNDTIANWQNTLKTPKLWWPRGHGQSFLYQDTVRIYLKSGVLSEVKAIQFGIQKSELVQEKDQWGTSYVLKINDKPIFCKGANLIPPSVFQSQITDSVWEQQIQVMKEQNFNMVRVWGGGLYPSNYFYKRCDEEGIMVWQDFMFACAMYPADSSFLHNVKAEMDYQIPRISSHPSVVLFNGNNEVDVAWKNWGFQKQYQLASEDSIQISEDYQKLFQVNLPNWVRHYSNIPYVHTSPLSNWGATERYNHGSQHYWGVWHGNDSIEEFSKNIGRFNSEFGFQSFPEYSTLLEISNQDSWNLDALGIKKHQKSYIGNGKIISTINRFFEDSKNFMEFVYQSQLVQANAMERAISAHRLNAPRCMGTLYWQMNDCYPGPTWSSVDYLGNRKILHYRMAETMQEIALTKQESECDFSIHLMSDYPQKSTIAFEIYGIAQIDKKIFKTKLTSDTIVVDYLKNQQIYSSDSFKTVFISSAILGFQIDYKANEKSNSKIIWLNQGKSKLAEKNKVKIRIKRIDRNSKTLVLQISTKKPIQDFWMYSTIPGIRFDDNDLQLLPGKKEVLIHFKNRPKNCELKWFGLEID